MRKKTRKILSTIAGAITLVIVAFAAFILVNNVIAVKENRPARIFGYSYSYVPTKSMEPTIKAGSWTIFKTCDYNALKERDIIVYKSQKGQMKDQYIIHRIHKKTEEGFIMKGDNNNDVDDEIVTKDMVYGIVVDSFYIAIFSTGFSEVLMNKNILFIFLFISLAVIIGVQGFNIYLATKKVKDKEQTTEELKKELIEELKREILEEERQKIKLKE